MRHVSYDRDPLVDVLAPPVVLAAPAVDAYNGDRPATNEDPTAEALFTRLHDSLPGIAERDGRLDMAAQALSAIADDVDVSSSLLERALEDQGVPEPYVRYATARGDDLETLLAALRVQLAGSDAYGDSAVGIGRSAGHAWIVVLAHVPRFHLARTPRWLAADGFIQIYGTLDPHWRRPTLTITRRDGHTERTAFAPVGSGYSALFACQGVPGRHWITIEAIDGANVQQRLVFAPIDCGGDSPSPFRTEPMANLRAADSGHRLAAIVNRERISAGLPPLRIDLRAQRAALEHLRLVDAGLIPLRSAEARFHVDDLRDAADQLLNDGELRSMLLRRDISHLGIAFVPDPKGGAEVGMVAVYIPAPVDTKRARADITHTLVHSSARGNLVPWDPLDDIAQWYAEQLAVGWSADVLEVQLQRKYLHVGWIRSSSLAVSVPAQMSELDVPAMLREHWVGYVGVGVVQCPYDGAFAGRLIVVVISARVR